MSFKRKNLVVAGLTLALLVASFYELPGVAMASSYCEFPGEHSALER
jgi:hypothetical protein